MKYFKKIICVLSLFSLVFSTFPFSKQVILAANDVEINFEIDELNLKKDSIGEYIEYENGDKVYLILYSSSRIETRSIATSVAVFVGGILVGWIVDGVIIYATGASGGEWVARALSYWRSNPNAKSIYLSKPDCSLYPPHTQFGCY